MTSSPSESDAGERPRNSSRGARILRRGALVLASLLAAEIVLRVVARSIHRERGIRFDADLGWRPLPDLVRVGREWGEDEPARTNSRGWRDADLPLEKAPGVVRIAALGDSFTWGFGVDDGERYTERLEALVEGLEVINFGVCSYGPDQELRLLETQALHYGPNVIVVQVFLGNDLDDLRLLRHSAWPKPHYELEGELLLLHPPRASFDVRLRESSYLGELVYRVFAGSIPRDVEAPYFRGRETLPLFGAIGARMRAVAEEHGAQLLFLLVHARDAPTSPSGVRDARVHAVLEKEGIAVLDLDGAFAARERAGEVLSSDDGHWNAAGHAVVARELAADLRGRGWLPAH